MNRKIGPYLYHDGFMAQKRFAAEEGSSLRTFAVVIAAAYDAGIVGPEHNGIAVLDEDRNQIVLDQHFRESSGYSGPSKRQRDEFNRVMAMDWEAFSEFCRTNPRFRQGSSPDIAAGRAPDYVEEDGLLEAIRSGKASETGKDIRTPEMKALDDEKASSEMGGFSFPCRTREQMIVHLARHAMHAPDRDGGAIAWNIKLGAIDFTGKGAEDTDPAFDERWKKEVEKNDQLFWEACSSALRTYVEGDYAPYPGEAEGKYEFGVTGRSGGWLYLRSWDGPMPGSGKREPMKFDGHAEYVDWLRGLEPADLARLYKLVACVDRDVAGRKAEVEHQLNFMRSQMEEMWTADAETSPAP